MTKYPKTKKKVVIDTLHSKKIKDNYRWLEDDNNQEVKNWDKEQSKLTRKYLKNKPQYKWLLDNFNEYGRYDYFGSITRVRKSERIFQRRRQKEQEKSVLFTASDENAPLEELINPNKWADDETLAYHHPSEDGKLVAFGKAKGGDEAPVLHVMDVESKEILSDKVKGWKQYIIDWLPDNSGFYYSANPLKGDVPGGEEYYWQATYLHKLGNKPSQDKKIWWDDEVKERWNYLYLTYDNKYMLYNKSMFYKNSFWIRKIGTDNKKTITADFDADYSVFYYNDKLYILTNKDAPNKKVYTTTAQNPEKDNWQEFIPETEFKIINFSIINGRVYVTYLKNVKTEIKIFDTQGNYLRNLPLPATGTAHVYGNPDMKDTWLVFSSFTFPHTIFRYNFEENELEDFFIPPLNLNLDNITTKQVWFESKDGTSIPMFLVHKKDINMDSSNAAILRGYGGFNYSLKPRFSLANAFWVKNDGILAIANLRGGGEFGEKWHRAGMKENKQNVFDDFIAAAEWLIDKNYTSTEKLALHGGSNGGLLIGAAVTQRPDLMKAALCQVPLLDMIRFHHSKIGNLWVEEYGNPDEATDFEYLLAYSPYHKIKEGEHYPAMLITTAVNDARVDPFHARKFAAVLQEKNASYNPIFLLVEDASGHGGGTTQSVTFKQRAYYYTFLMDQLGIKVK